MRHRIAHRKLNRTSEHRVALRRNLAQNLIEHGQIRTTVAKAKDVRPFVEKIITLACRARRKEEQGDKAGGLRARRGLHKLLSDRSLIPAEHRNDYVQMSDSQRRATLRSPSGRRYRTGQPKGRLDFTGQSVLHRLIENVAPNFMDRPGGYTRIIKLPDRRVGDHSQLAILQFVGHEQAPTGLARRGKSWRKRKIDRRYAAAIEANKKSATREIRPAPSSAGSAAKASSGAEAGAES